MSTVKRECQVVMLPTEKASKVCLSTSSATHRLFIPVVNLELSEEALSKYKAAGSIPHHIYILSDDEIKKGDWVIMLDSFGNVFSNPQQYTDPKTQHLNKGLRKIIATTDSLCIGFGDDHDPRSGTGGNPIWLPQPSQSFIQKYIDAYNSGKPIEKVMVDYEEWYKMKEDYPMDEVGWHERLKINPKDNTITISKVKDSWTREEVSILIRKAILDYSTGYSRSSDKWIEENL